MCRNGCGCSFGSYPRPQNVGSGIRRIELKPKAFQPDRQGKVRDIYDLGDTLLLVATDRISAFDVVLPDIIPNKGRVLTQMSVFWFELLGDIVPNHLISTELADLPRDFLTRLTGEQQQWLDGRFMLVRKAQVLPVECIVRGNITGSGWSSYKKNGTVCGIELPQGLLESQQLDPPLFTPSTKAEIGAHDENISYEQMVEIVGLKTAKWLRSVSNEIFKHARDHAAQCGIILADTKFEFGMIEGTLTLIDEVLTPDSSRFWPAEGFEPGHGQPSFDKQFVRDWLKSVGFTGAEGQEVPRLPQDIIDKTSAKCIQAYELITGHKFQSEAA